MLLKRPQPSRLLTWRLKALVPGPQQEQASALHAMGMLDYGALKGRLTVATAALVASGTGIFAVTGARSFLTTSLQQLQCSLSE